MALPLVSPRFTVSLDDLSYTVHLIAGFESQIAARGAVGALVRAMNQSGMSVAGVALVRRDTERGVHVDTMRGYELPAHVLQALDAVIEDDRDGPTLHAGQVALVVSTEPEDLGSGHESLAERADLAGLGALWVSVAPDASTNRKPEL